MQRGACARRSTKRDGLGDGRTDSNRHATESIIACGLVITGHRGGGYSARLGLSLARRVPKWITSALVFRVIFATVTSKSCIAQWCLLFSADEPGRTRNCSSGSNLGNSGADGVFVADRKVADLIQVVEHITRPDVTEVRGPLSYSPRRDALVGLASGALIILGLGTTLCCGSCGSDEPRVLDAAALNGAMLAGIFVAGGAVKHAVRNPRT